MESAAERDGHVLMLLGAYVLGGLSAGEASAVRAHLVCCARCRAEHDELAAVPSWLDLLGAADGGGEQVEAAREPGDPDYPPGPRSAT